MDLHLRFVFWTFFLELELDLDTIMNNHDEIEVHRAALKQLPFL